MIQNKFDKAGWKRHQISFEEKDGGGSEATSKAL